MEFCKRPLHLLYKGDLSPCRESLVVRAAAAMGAAFLRAGYTNAHVWGWTFQGGTHTGRHTYLRVKDRMKGIMRGTYGVASKAYPSKRFARSSPHRSIRLIDSTLASSGRPWLR